ncbi:type 1 glutamine amidotransferase [Pusillimonas sp. CC-YST705]|uniref:Type 1 glutamine amidotransferase n=1 Tax=Mesopusillimonas faecipullorum TaxID=2755040 RepID=A0ABS8CDU0_9BURK|nr:type 1 glutamine amidotransferase [Mesopusillimonas faecipullorum]MCB5364168.1 type 1 glutamine amidotransferase [Mesopusillimonas faecipullorum]
MKPIAIFQHTHVGEPGAVLSTLNELSLPWVMVPIMDGAPIPEDPEAYSGIVLMGGGMGVNDGLDWLAREIAFVRRADEAGVPVIGHCLGGQILATALGGHVEKGPRMEIGWQAVQYEPEPVVREWLGESLSDELFQWHQDIFILPEGAQRLAHSDVCPNQAFVYGNRHLGMQFHLEMTPELVVSLSQANRASHERELARNNPSTSSREEMLAQLDVRTQRMHQMMRTAYARWARGLK